MIVNITSAHNCPSDNLGLCPHSKVCYAKKCERIYKSYLAKNLLVEELMNKWSKEDIIEILESYINNCPHEIKYIRLNEAGDFPNQQSVDLWDEIAEYFDNYYNIKTYCYTCRSDLNFCHIIHYNVNASITSIHAQRYFLCVDKETYAQLDPKVVKCKGDCRICSLCYKSSYKGVIYVKQH